MKIFIIIKKISIYFLCGIINLSGTILFQAVLLPGPKSAVVPNPLWLVSLILFLQGGLYVLWYELIGYAFFNKKKILSGIFNGLIFMIASYFTQTLMLTGAYYDGVNLSSVLKGIDLRSIFNDGIVTLATFIVAALLIRKKNLNIFSKKLKFKNILLSISGFFVLPLIGLIVTLISEFLFPVLFPALSRKNEIPIKNIFVFNGICIASYCIPGIILLLTNLKLNYSENNKFYHPIQFNTIFVLCFWIPVTLMMLTYGMKYSVISYIVQSIIMFYLYSIFGIIILKLNKKYS